MATAKEQIFQQFFKKAVVALAFLPAPILCCAQARTMPAIEGKTLAGETLHIPPSGNNSPVVLVFGFARSAKDQGVAWGKELVALQQENSGFDFYQVAMLDGAPRFTHSLITKAIRAEVPPAYYSHTLLLTSGEKAWKKALSVADNDEAYVAICRPSGEIQWETKGVGEEQFAALRAHLRADEIASR